MLCSLTKRLISRREDTGKPLPARIERHLHNCPSCREFERFCSSIREKSTNALGKTSGTEAAMSSRILAALESDVERRPVKTRRHRLIPTPVFAGLLAVALIGVIWLGSPRRSSLPHLNQMIDFEKVGALREGFISVESPLRQEKEEFERTLDSAVRFLASSLDPGLGD